MRSPDCVLYATGHAERAGADYAAGPHDDFQGSRFLSRCQEIDARDRPGFRRRNGQDYSRAVQVRAFSRKQAQGNPGTSKVARRSDGGTMKKFCWLILLGLTSIASDGLAQGEPFYKGKTVRIMVGFAPGGVMDLWARLLAQHLGKYIPGKPSVIVQNMTGAGSMTAANYVYSVAKPDGLTLGLIFPALYFDQHLGAKEV